MPPLTTASEFAFTEPVLQSEASKVNCSFHFFYSTFLSFYLMLFILIFVWFFYCIYTDIFVGALNFFAELETHYFEIVSGLILKRLYMFRFVGSSLQYFYRKNIHIMVLFACAFKKSCLMNLIQ
jgi:hypothetical protein